MIMRHARFLSSVATSNQAGHGLDREFERIIPAHVVFDAGRDETSSLTKLLAASQSLATTAAAHRASKVGGDLFASLILLALRRYQNRAHCNNGLL
jgi:hypothetical protein